MNALEFYDFTIATFFAVPIGRVFFPVSNPWTSLLLSVASLGTGYLARPMGALVIGTVADRRGRKSAMVITALLIAFSTFGIAVLPGYATLGVASPIILVALRLLQGFALGGETGPAVAFLIESAKAGRQGKAVVWYVASNGAALLAAGAVGFALSASLDHSALEAWGWRIALLLGLGLVPVGLVVRTRLNHDRPLPQSLKRAGGRSFVEHLMHLVTAFFVLGSGTVSFSIGSFMTSYGMQALHLGSHVAFLASMALGAATLTVAPLGGWLADRVGRRRSVVMSRLAVATFAWPGFSWMTNSEGWAALLVVSFGLAAMSTIGTPSALCLVADALPSRSRAAALSTIYALSIGMFAAATQPAATALLAFTNDYRSPAWLLVGAGLIGAVAALASPSTKNICGTT